MVEAPGRQKVVCGIGVGGILFQEHQPEAFKNTTATWAVAQIFI